MRFKVSSDLRLILVPVLIVLCSPFSNAASLPKRDHLTPKEADLVRDTQELDKRIAILIQAADRRLLALSGTKANQKEIDMLGELKGTRADFLYDLSKILDEAIVNIDDVSTRDESNPLVPKAIRKLAEASSHILAGLLPFRDKVEAGVERLSYEEAVENAQSVVEAAGKLPPPAKSTKKKNSDK